MQEKAAEIETSELPYDVFAPVYDHFFGPEAARATTRALEVLLLNELPRRSRILDLCCGTGELSGWLTHAGYRVTGVDNSGQMLRFAQKRVPSAAFYQADIREFRPEGKFDAAVSAYNSLPHITAPEDLLRVFSNVRNSLHDGGVFVFDLYSDAAYAERWRGSFSKVDENFVCIVRASYHRQSARGENLITVFRRDKQWERTDTTLTTRCYSSDELHGLLQQAGFGSIEEHEAAELGVTGADGRVFWRCRAL